jgi:hypothetical protein
VRSGILILFFFFFPKKIRVIQLNILVNSEKHRDFRYLIYRNAPGQSIARKINIITTSASFWVLFYPTFLPREQEAGAVVRQRG